MSNSATIYDVKLGYQGAVALILAHQNGLLSGDGAPERIKLYEAIMDPVRKHDEAEAEAKKLASKSNEPPPKSTEFSLELKVSSGTVKAWLSGAANSIMRHQSLANGMPMNDTHVALLFDGAKALGFADELRKRVPAYNAGEELLMRDEEPEELVRDNAPVANPTSSESNAAESGAPPTDVAE